MIILGIETTCDETGAAVVEDNSSKGLKILSNVVASSVDLQKKYGGVVPEVAAREQIKVIIPVIEQALEKASGTISDQTPNPNVQEWARENIDAIAVAYGPGLVGSLLIGVETAKTLALAWDKPLIAVNHLVGHIYANWIRLDHSREIMDHRKNMPTTNYGLQTQNFPLVGLIVSGGHTDLVLMRGHGDFKLLGSTLDDAAGEAFDKVAKLLGLSYPGGPEIERVAQQLTTDKRQLTITFPRPLLASSNFDFSFSGLKTAVVNHVNQVSDVKGQMSAIAAEFQRAAVDVLVSKTIRAAEKFDCQTIAIGGGVAANELLRSLLADSASRLDIEVLFPTKNLAVDNGAMIAAAAFFVNKKVDSLKLQANPVLHF